MKKTEGKKIHLVVCDKFVRLERLVLFFIYAVRSVKAVLANMRAVLRSKIENQCFLRARRRNVGENERHTSNKVHRVGGFGGAIRFS